MEEPRIEAIEEIVIAVNEANKAVEYFKDLFGLSFPLGWELPQEKIKVRSERIAGTQLQFIEATQPDSVVAKFLKEKGQGLNHMAFRVKNLGEMVRRLKEKGVKIIPEEPREIENNKLPVETSRLQYVFIHPKSAFGVLIELIEPK